MVLVHNEQLQTMIPTFILTQWYYTALPMALAEQGLLRLCPTPASVKTLANTNLNKVFHTELYYCKKHWTVSWDLVHTMNWAEDNTQVPHMPELQTVLLLLPEEEGS